MIREDKLKIHEHSDEVSTTPVVYYKARKVHGDVQVDILKQHNVGIKPAQNTYNMQQRSMMNDLLNQVNEVRDFLKSRAYNVRYSHSEGVVERLFVSHKAAIRRVQRFPEVVIIDTAYKTNYVVQPSEECSFTAHILCAWHINNNFKVHAAECFQHGSKEHDTFFKGAVGKMIWSKDEEEFSKTLQTYRRLTSKTSKAQVLQSYINSLLSWAGPWAERHTFWIPDNPASRRCSLAAQADPEHAGQPEEAIQWHL
ncbi:hypothetical protein EC973_008996 [Apophysomyces ossiformis]|uniref:MULE transposase domain-containing protein n=1 Tax=Apophysomyces ossiformis TaxID=679940 RepID=A0A8H7BPR7_9FUNG|nr:hypothetical protein EC973_008996 [Apophysomyces ossiformis]